MRFSWPALNVLATDMPSRIVLLSPMTKVLADMAYSFYSEMFRWLGESYQLTDNEIDEIKAAVDKYMHEMEVSVLIGAILPYVGNNVPDGTLPCDGLTYNKADYPELYAYLLDTDFIVNEDTFTTPIFENRVIAQASGSHDALSTLGEEEHTLVGDEMPIHAHTESAVTTSLGLIGEVPELVSVGTASTTGSAGGDAAHNNMQPTIYLNFCIVAGRNSIVPTLATYYLFETADFDYTIDDNTPVNLGVRFRSTVTGKVKGVRIWKRETNGNGQIVALWSNTGDQLATANIPDDVTGWVDGIFSSPVDIDAEVTYVASMYSPSGQFVSSPDFFDAQWTNAPLIGLQDGDDGDNGCYSYAGTLTFPTSTIFSANYWVNPILEA